MKFQLKSVLLIALLLSGSRATNAQLIRNKTTLDHMQQMLAQQKHIASARNKNLFRILDQKITPEEKQALEYLYAYMPLSDLADYDGDFFLAQMRSTLKSRDEMPWGKLVPEEEFLHFVLPVRVNNENPDAFRSTMYDELKQRIKGLSMREAALEVNHWCHEKVTYRASDNRTGSPLASVRTSFGRCGEESTFTVAAMRTLGIPARQVYTPRWAHSDDNHAWVEVWIDGKWYFLGACEPEADLNMGWFSEPVRRAMLVHTRAYGWYNGSEPVIQREERFSELNLIGNYAPVKTFSVRVTDEHMHPVENAEVEFQLYNYAEFYPIARNKTDKNGTTSISSGLGDLIIWAAKDNNFAYKKITVEATDTLHLQLVSSHPDGISEIYDLVPPVERKPLAQDDRGNARNARRLHSEDSIRFAYMATFKDSTWSTALANKLGIDADSIGNAIRLSYGNWEEISDFLNSVTPAQRHWALRILSVITEKDLRDTRAEILRDHLLNALPLYNSLHFTDPVFFTENVMCGRISNELMISWRSFLQTKFDKAFALAARNNINLITGWIEKNISLDNTANLHSRAPLTPRGVYELKVADAHSRDIFFVAVCRSLGIPARINQATSMPQYFTNNEWANVPFDRPIETANKKGFVHLLNGNAAIMPKYAINFTIARLVNGFYRTLEYEYETKLDAFPEKLEVESGSYMLVTGNRQADGSVLSSITFFRVNTQEITTIAVDVRETGTKQAPWALLDMKDLNLTDYKSGQSSGLADAILPNGAVMVWIDPEKEPSRHVMADIPSVRGVFESWGGSVIFLLDKNKIGPSFRTDNFPGLPAQTMFVYDNNNILFDRIERLKGQKLTGNLPVIVVSDALGNLVYFSEGYKIGVGEQLTKEIGRLK